MLGSCPYRSGVGDCLKVEEVLGVIVTKEGCCISHHELLALEVPEVVDEESDELEICSCLWG